ncbi:MAG: SGNH/GDSL hydrolase family protein [Chloroflexi bacterium]|nr:SGNH/GDSL hydrolase family protein [Chloroflexota bacterium]
MINYRRGRTALRCLAACLAAVAAMVTSAGAAPRGAFPFRNGDRVVFLGDSITEQRLYTTYLETYLLTRFPTWKLQFRNAGWGGDTSWLRMRGVPPAQGLVRDVLSLNPTVVTIDFGMNDAGYGAFQQSLYTQHINGMRDIVNQLKAAGVRPIVLTASAVEKREPGDNMVGYNEALGRFADGDRALAAEEHVPFADQFHPFVAAINRFRRLHPDSRLSSDVVHPGPPGHLMMADFILTGLDAPAVVSSAAINAHTGRVTQHEGAKITAVKIAGGGVSFRRLDDALVFPIEASAHPVLEIVPVADDIDRYTLRVTDLAPGDYTVSVNGSAVSNFSAAQLDAGVNLSRYDSPLIAQGLDILKQVYAKNNLYFTLWRQVQLGKAPDRQNRIQDLASQIAGEERQINALRAPKTYDFSVMPVRG